MKRGSRSRPNHTLKKIFWSDGQKLKSVDIINERWP